MTVVLNHHVPYQVVNCKTQVNDCFVFKKNSDPLSYKIYIFI